MIFNIFFIYIHRKLWFTIYVYTICLQKNDNYIQNIIHATYLLCLTISLNSLSLNDALGIYSLS